jgi:hypothetical protein
MVLAEETKFDEQTGRFRKCKLTGNKKPGEVGYPKNEETYPPGLLSLRCNTAKTVSIPLGPILEIQTSKLEIRKERNPRYAFARNQIIGGQNGTFVFSLITSKY